MWRKIGVFGYEVICKTLDEPSKYGIFGGRISKMSIYRNKEEVFNYDRGTDFSDLPEWVVEKIVHAIEVFL